MKEGQQKCGKVFFEPSLTKFCHLNLANGWATAKYRSTEMATVENMEPTLEQHICILEPFLQFIAKYKESSTNPPPL